MRLHSILFTIILFVSFANHASATSGSIKLDEINFYKVINKFKASLIKFDILFPFGDKHKAFKALAKESIHEKDLLIAEVLVTGNADNHKTNEAFARKYGATKNNLPVVMLFVKGKSEPIPFVDWKGFTIDELRRFVRDNSGLYLSLPGCVKEFDKLAIQFMQGERVEREKVLKKAEELLKNMNKESSSGNIYKTIMEKVLEKGDDFIQSELDRVKNLLSGKVSEEKKKQLGIRINIQQAFQLLDKQPSVAKVDL